MKLKIIFTLIIILLISQLNVNAKILRVGRIGAGVGGTDFGDLQSAVNNASTTVLDTIMLYPGAWSSNIDRKVALIGAGYFIAGAGANVGLQNTNGYISVNLTVISGADSSIYEGIDHLNITTQGSINKVIIRRCYCSNLVISGGNQPGNQCDSWKIVQTFLENGIYQPQGTTIITNWDISNSFLTQFAINSGTAQTGLIRNCILSGGGINFANASFIIQNSILLSYHYGDVNCIYQNCLGNTNSPIPGGNNNSNIPNSNMLDSVFVGYGTLGSYTYDNRWALRANSPAIGTGINGANMGMFGGTNPYKLSGMPSIPAFYKLTAPSNITSTNPYTITFSVRGNN